MGLFPHGGRSLKTGQANRLPYDIYCCGAPELLIGKWIAKRWRCGMPVERTGQACKRADRKGNYKKVEMWHAG